MAKKPKPKMLGTGAARRAADKLKRRGSRIDAAVDAAVNGNKKKRKK